MVGIILGLLIVLSSRKNDLNMNIIKKNKIIIILVLTWCKTRVKMSMYKSKLYVNIIEEYKIYKKIIIKNPN